MNAVLQFRRENFVAVAVVGLLGIMMIPVPPAVLDVLLSLSISVSIVILLTSIYITKPLDFSIFPSLLLIVTLFRLSLNVASTRLILLRGAEGTDAAGGVIRSFGSFVVGGNYVVGFVVFLILVVINYVVITKGAGRIAEVAARFILDAMPGKQMAIDADLNAGIIDEAEARRRRELISHEADFYGAMDGASKFVKGDAVVGLVIMVINIVGGLVIGMAQHSMSVGDAARTFTILTIGDGLVSQIPSLLISTAAGIVVSRASADTDFGVEITRQVLFNPKALATTAAIVFVLGLVPGIPTLPFVLLASALGATAYLVGRIPRREETAAETTEAEVEQPIEHFVEVEPLTLEIGFGLISLVERDDADLLAKIREMRRQIATELGFVVAPIHIKDNLQLNPHQYRILLKGVEVAKGEVMMGYWLAIRAEGEGEVEGIPTTEPAFGLPALWVAEDKVDEAQRAGYTVVDVQTTIVTHVAEVVRRHAWELLSRSDVQAMLDAVAERYPKLVDELVPSNLTLGGVQRVLQNLLRERIPVRDLVTILEALLDHAPTVKEIDVLTERVRQALARQITSLYVAPDGVLYAMVLDAALDREIVEAAASGTVDGGLVGRVAAAIKRSFSPDAFGGATPVLLCSADARRTLRRITEKFLPSLVVLSSAEVHPSAKTQIVGVVGDEGA